MSYQVCVLFWPKIDFEVSFVFSLNMFIPLRQIEILDTFFSFEFQNAMGSRNVAQFPHLGPSFTPDVYLLVQRFNWYYVIRMFWSLSPIN